MNTVELPSADFKASDAPVSTTVSKKGKQQTSMIDDRLWVAARDSVNNAIVCPTAFGHDLFNRTVSVFPEKAQSLVGFFRSKYDRALALYALTVSAAGKDIYSVFASLELMAYHGIVLPFSGHQTDESHIRPLCLIL
ncbi:Mitochondrial outer membrane protein iml2 [Marasmius sp. AFHP31]|nr:Mitochondrial outer membrane protein iml2 [Marasmius sp. AFHP31]